MWENLLLHTGHLQRKGEGLDVWRELQPGKNTLFCMLLGSGLVQFPDWYIYALLQNFLETPGVVHFLEQQLNGTFWNITILRQFLSLGTGGQGYTWHNAYAEVDAVINTLTQFVEVRLESCCLCFVPAP